MTENEISKVATYYLNTFAAPLLRSSNEDQLKKHIELAASIISDNMKINIGVAQFSLTKVLKKSTQIIDVDRYPVVSVVDFTLDDEALDADDYTYEIMSTGVLFHTAILPGTFKMTYTAGSELLEKEKQAICLLINHLIEIKMINSERVGVVSVSPDRDIIPREVKVLLGFSSMDIGTL